MGEMALSTFLQDARTAASAKATAAFADQTFNPIPALYEDHEPFMFQRTQPVAHDPTEPVCSQI